MTKMVNLYEAKTQLSQLVDDLFELVHRVPGAAAFCAARRGRRGAFAAVRVVRVDFVRFTAMLTSWGWGYSNQFPG